MSFEPEQEEDGLYEDDLRIKAGDDIYDEEFAEEAAENDQLSGKEAGFMRGYNVLRGEEDFWDINDL